MKPGAGIQFTFYIVHKCLIISLCWGGSVDVMITFGITLSELSKNGRHKEFEEHKLDENLLFITLN